MANNNYPYPYNTNTAPIGQYFPQPQGNVYMINNSMELANIPASTGLTVALCPSESLMYLKSIQNGQPAVMCYTLTAQTNIQGADFEERFNALERQIADLKKMWEGE